MLGSLIKNRFYVKLKKYEFWLSGVDFLGHVVYQHGISVNLSKVFLKLKKLWIGRDLPNVNEEPFWAWHVNRGN